MPESSDVIPGAEPFLHAGGPVGVLVVHGFTGTPGTMRPLADGLAEAGFTVSMPRLPGHGTTVEEMIDTRFDDWAAAVEGAYADLAARCEATVVAGLSMGGTLTCWLAARHPEIAGIVCINPAVSPSPPELVEMVQAMVDAGETTAPGIGSDIAKPGATEIAYDAAPLQPLLSMWEALEQLQDRLVDIRCPVLLMTSPEDHVVEPANSDHLAASVSGPVARVSLDRSYHVATLDHDADLILERTVAFARDVAVVE